jgi:hypothetical protein
MRGDVGGGIGERSEAVKSLSSGRAHAGATVNEVGGVLRLATELLPNDSLTWHLLLPMGNISARWLSHDDRRDQILLTIGNIFCGVLAADRTTTETTRNDADQRKTTQTPHPSARDGSGIPILRDHISVASLGPRC